MTEILSGDALTYWRQHPQRVRGFVVVFPQDRVVSRRVNQSSFSYPLHQLTFDNPDSDPGSVDDVEVGMLIEFLDGTTGVSKGLSRVRKSISGSSLFIAPIGRGDYDAADNDIINIYDNYVPFSHIPYISSTGVLYKDYNEAYTDQTKNFPPVANAGPARAGFVNDDNVLIVELNAINSFAVADGASIVSYLWDVKDGVITVGSDSDAEITVEFPAGYRWIKLTITDSNGVEAIARVPIWAANTTTYAPMEASMSKRAYSGHHVGWEASFELYDVDTSIFPEYAFVIYWEEEWQGAHKGSLTGYPGAEHVKFVGWISHEYLEMHGLWNQHTIEAKGPLGHISQRPAFPQSVRRVANPSKWHQVKGLDWWKAVMYILRFHSNILEICDIERPSFYADLPSKGFDIEAETLYEQVKFLANACFCEFTCDHNGILYIRRNPHLMTSGERSVWNPIVAMDENDLLGDQDGPKFEYESWSSVAWLRSSAIGSSTSEFPAFLSVAPGALPGQGISRESADRLFVADQTELNVRTGMLYAYYQSRRNGARVARRGTLSLAHRGDVIDPAWLRPFTLTLPSSFNRRGVSFNEARFVPLSLDILYDHEEGLGLERLEVEEETMGAPATTEILPEETIYDNPPMDDWEPIPIIVPEPEPITPGDMGRAYALTTTSFRVTENLSAETPSWTEIWTPPAGEFRAFLLDLYDPLNKAIIVSSSSADSETYIYELTNLSSGSPTPTLKQTIGHASSGVKLVNTVQWADTWFLACRSQAGDGKSVHVYHTHNRWNTMTTVLDAGRCEGNPSVVFAVSSNAKSQTSGNVYVGHLGSSGVSWLRRSTDYGHSFSNFYQFPGWYYPNGLWIPWLENANDQYIYAIWERRLYASVDGGMTFTNRGFSDVGRGVAHQQYNPISYTLDPRGIYFTTGVSSTATIMRSSDAGVTADTMGSTQVQNLGYVNLGGWPFPPYEGLILNSPIGLKVSLDGGETWTNKGWSGGSNYIWTIPVWVAT